MKSSLLKSLEMIKKALVVGGGLAGIEVATGLAEAGIEVFLVEKEAELGGNLKLANLPEIDSQIKGIHKNKLIKVFTRSEISSLSGTSGNFTLCLTGKNKETLNAGVIVIATGCCLSLKNVIDFEISPKLIGQFDLSLKLARSEALPERICFLLDLAGEDLRIATFSLFKQLMAIKDKFYSDIFVLCKDLKVSFDGAEDLYRKVREKGVIFIKYSEKPEIVLENGNVRVRLKEEDFPHSVTEIVSDLLVVGEEVLPRLESKGLASMLEVGLDSRGFFQDENIRLLPVFSPRKGIFFVGSCRWPQTLVEAKIEARVAVSEVLTFLSQDVEELKKGAAQVDSQKCVLCLTCIRTCPHRAILIDHEDESARVIDQACQQCGICAGECPVRAIKLA